MEDGFYLKNGEFCQWGIMYSSAEVYDDTFRDHVESLAAKSAVLKSIRNLCSERDLNCFDAWVSLFNGPVLDLMSYGTFIHSLNTKGCAVGLSDQRSSKVFANKDITFIEGDVNSELIWHEVDKYLSQNRFEGFPLVVCHPLGAVDALKVNFDLFLNNVYQRLLPEGLFFTQLPYGLKSEVLGTRRGKKNLRTNDFYLEVLINPPTMMLIKTATSRIKDI